MRPFYIKLLSVVLICGWGTVVYSNTFHALFQLDDASSITENFSIRDISHPEKIWAFWPSRFLTYFSFALDYHFHRLDVFGYHLFNLMVHLVSSVLVWWLALLTFSTPAMKGEVSGRKAEVIALFAGLVFVSHPVQTEAVTYLVQRAASMAAMFYLASLCFYVKSRLLFIEKHSSLPLVGRAREGGGKGYYVCSLITAVAAMFTKEMAITLPLMVWLYEHTFFKRGPDAAASKKHITPFLLILPVIPLTVLCTHSWDFQQMHRVGERPTEIPSLHYLLTQLRVMITYVRLAFLPVNLNVDYDYPVYKSIFQWPVLGSVLFLTAVLWCAARLYGRYRLLTFSIFWFFLTLLPESSLFPIKDIIFEHRLYLPMAGYSLFLASGAYYLLARNSLKPMAFALMIIIAFNSVLTYQRNKVWRNEVTLWSDAVRKSPYKARPYNNRGVGYFRLGDYTQAMADFSKAIALDPAFAQAYTNRGNLYGRQNDFTRAISDYNKAVALDPQSALAYKNRGNFYSERGDLIRAIGDYDRAIALKPDFRDVYNSRGNSYRRLGTLPQALADLNKTLDIDPQLEAAYYNRGLAYDQQGRLAQALSDYNKALELNPKDAQVYYDRAILYGRLKEWAQALSDARQAHNLGYQDSARLFQALKKASYLSPHRY